MPDSTESFELWLRRRYKLSRIYTKESREQYRELTNKMLAQLAEHGDMYSSVSDADRALLEKGLSDALFENKSEEAKTRAVQDIVEAFRESRTSKTRLKQRREKFQEDFHVSLSTVIRLERAGGKQIAKMWDDVAQSVATQEVRAPARDLDVSVRRYEQLLREKDAEIAALKSKLREREDVIARFKTMLRDV